MADVCAPVDVQENVRAGVPQGDVRHDDVPQGDVPQGDALAGLRRALDVLLALDPMMLADGHSVLELLREASRFEALTCRQAVAFDAGAEWAVVGAQNSSAWVTTQARCDRPQARRRLRLGRALRSMDLVDTAFRSGTIGADHVEVLAGAHKPATARAFARDEAMLVGWAETLMFHQFSRAVEMWSQHADEDGAESGAEQQHSRRRFHMSQSFENVWFADGVLDPISGEIVHGALTRIERELFRADWAGAASRLGRDPLVDELPRTPAQRRADALVEMARRAETAPAGGRRPAPLFTVLVGEQTFARTCELASGTIITPGSLAWWLDQSLIERIEFDGPNRVIGVGRPRAFTGALKRAIQVRDRTCTHPYCDKPAEHCEIDHIRPHADGGRSTQENGRLLCGFHNRLRNTRPRQKTHTVFA
jgi:Domain of unknown function (DUF222)/HNH endonuclease